MVIYRRNTSNTKQDIPKISLHIQKMLYLEQFTIYNSKLTEDLGFSAFFIPTIKIKWPCPAHFFFCLPYLSARFLLKVEQGSGSMSEENQLGEQIRFCPKSVVVESRIRERGITRKTEIWLQYICPGFHIIILVLFICLPGLLNINTSLYPSVWFLLKTEHVSKTISACSSIEDFPQEKSLKGTQFG